MIEADRPIRVLRIATRLNVGGPARHVVALDAMDPARFEARLAVGTPGPDEGDMLSLRPDLRRHLGKRIVTVPGLGRDPRLGGDFIAYRFLCRLIGGYRPDIVDTHLTKAGTLGRLAAYRMGVPATIHTFHGTSFAGHFPEPVGRAFALWERLLAARTSAVIAVSDAVAADLDRRSIGRGRITTLPYGLDLEEFGAVSEPPSPLSPVITLIARLAPVKDVPLFIEAAAIARRSIPELRARVAGDGPLRSSLQQSAPPWVEWLGNRADMAQVIESSGVVVLTSHSEGSPFALIEALASARPVVAVPVGGVVDLLRDRPGAILTSSRAAEEIGKAIVQALKEPEIRHGAIEGRRKVIDEFSQEQLLASTAELYRRILAKT